MSVLATAIGALALGVTVMIWRRTSRPAPSPSLTPDELFEQEYLARVRRGLRYVDLKGLQTASHSSLELDKVYVDVGLVRRAPHRVGTDVLAGLPEAVQGRWPLDHFLSSETPQVLAVLGGPGSGKTTLLRKTARAICDTGTPILLFLRDHLTEILRGASLPEIVTGTLARYDLADPHEWVARRLRSGRCVVMLDGLDEVARSEDRRSVSAWVERQITAFPDNDFVLTSRRQGFQDAPVDGAVVLQVRPFTPTQVREFVHGWYRAVAGTITQDAEERAAEEAEDLLTRLDSAPALGDLTVNPLLLTMIATVHQFRGALPGSRADLYREICEVVLWHRDEAKKLVAVGNNRHKMVLLRSLAYLMMTNGVRQLPREVLLAEFDRLLRRLSTPLDAEGHLARIVSDGMLVEWERDQFAFAHLTFQEYLAAAYIREKNLIDTLYNAVDDDWWRETTLLYVAGSDADPVVEACLTSRTSAALGLALDCVAEGVELDERLRSELDSVVDAAANDPELRGKVVQAMMARHARSVVRTESGVLVCRNPVPAALYRLLQASPGVKGTGDEPARGMDALDALEFVESLWRTSSSPYRFRLAQAADLDDPTVLPIVKSLSVWIVDTRAHTLVPWSHGPSPRLVTLDEVLNAAREDLRPDRMRALMRWSTTDISAHRVGIGILFTTFFTEQHESDQAFLTEQGDGAEATALMRLVWEQVLQQARETTWHPEPIGDVGTVVPQLYDTGHRQQPWSIATLKLLQDMVSDWDTTGSLSPSRARRMRMMALMVATDVDKPAVLYKLAAAATLWDQWRSGKRERSEVIILAADAPESLSARRPR
ncbi:NACHT domain-containing protein [Actinokineospora globicatena]|nr:NACHT domain-containing protein [Actinokineospora globicatena]